MKEINKQCSGYDLKAYIQFFVHQMGTLSQAASLVLFKKSWLMPAPGYPFTLPQPHIHHP